MNILNNMKMNLLKFNFSSILRRRADKLLEAISLTWNWRLACGTKDEQPLVDSLLSDRSSP